jgi:hypothetical protein
MSKGSAHIMPQVMYDPRAFAVRKVEDVVRPISSAHANWTAAGLLICVGILAVCALWMLGVR